MRMEKLTPVLIVSEIEPCLSFWIERLGFALQAEVKDEDRLAFVLLAKDGVEVMYQSAKSAMADMPQLTARDRECSICLYFEVGDLASVENALRGVPFVQPRRTTFYGATEIGVREPSGNLVMFAQRSTKE
jgi:uncharacterized glyoxalase superfamily protein PhnB